MTAGWRVGIGFDIHPLVVKRRLVLGGVEVPFGKGLGGWSDGDVLSHAIIDALLGAASMGDIGRFFPPGDPEYKDCSSLVLLGRVKGKLDGEGWVIGNIDTVIIAAKPKLEKFIEPMRKKISQILDVDLGGVSVKAKTTNGIGLIARGEGIAAQAVVLLVRLPRYKSRGEKIEGI